MPACLPKALLAPDVALISVLCAFAVLVTAFAALDSAAVHPPDILAHPSVLDADRICGSVLYQHIFVDDDL